MKRGYEIPDKYKGHGINLLEHWSKEGNQEVWSSENNNNWYIEGFPRPEDSLHTSSLVDVAHERYPWIRIYVGYHHILFRGNTSVYQGKFQDNISKCSKRDEFISTVMAVNGINMIRTIITEFLFKKISNSQILEDNAADIIMKNQPNLNIVQEMWIFIIFNCNNGFINRYINISYYRYSKLYW